MNRCASEATLSAFVDDALPGDARDRVATHLAECPACCAEVAALRRVQRLLSTTRSPAADDPAPLADRLVSIAGGGARQPLWTQPFDRPLNTRAPLPSRRRARRRNLTGAVVLLAGVMISLVGVGWVAAPPPDVPIVNPVAKARAEFSHVAAQRPFVMDSTVALWAMPAAEQQAHVTNGPIRNLPVLPGRRLTAAEARTVLSAGQHAARVLDHRSMQQVHVAEATGRVTIGVAVSHHSAQGTQVEVLGNTNRPGRTAFLPVRSPDAVPAPEEVTGLLDQEVLGRPAVLVEARRDGVLVARWWFDKRTALQLAQETYQDDGSVQLQAVVTDLSVDAQEFIAHTPPRLVRPGAAAYLSLSELGEVRSRGWSCHHDLSGLPITRLGNDPGTAVQTTYSDGASAVTVRQERGTILQAPEGFAWDEELGAYRRDGSPTMMIWQSRDSVFTVVTDGSADMAAGAVAELPHEAPVLRTRFGRVQAGWQHVVDTVVGR